MTSEVLAKVWEVLSTHAMSYQTREYSHEREREEVLDTGVRWWLHIISRGWSCAFKYHTLSPSRDEMHCL